jgi:hypothetical protein
MKFSTGKQRLQRWVTESTNGAYLLTFKLFKGIATAFSALCQMGLVPASMSTV